MYYVKYILFNKYSSRESIRSFLFSFILFVQTNWKKEIKERENKNSRVSLEDIMSLSYYKNEQELYKYHYMGHEKKKSTGKMPSAEREMGSA